MITLVEKIVAALETVLPTAEIVGVIAVGDGAVILVKEAGAYITWRYNDGYMHTGRYDLVDIAAGLDSLHKRAFTSFVW